LESCILHVAYTVSAQVVKLPALVAVYDTLKHGLTARIHPRQRHFNSVAGLLE
jgi:hypothetical protein